MARFLNQESASPPSPLTAALIPSSTIDLVLTSPPPRPTLAYPPIFLPPSSYDFSPSPSPLPSISSAHHASLPKAALVGATVAGAVVTLAVAATVLSAVAGKMGFSLLSPAWSLLSSVTRKLSFSRFQQDHGEHGAEDREIDVYSLTLGDAMKKAGSTAEATMSASLTEIVSGECESSTEPFVSKSNLSKYAASELKKHAVIIPGGVVTSEKRVHKMIDELGKVSACSGGGGNDAAKSTANSAIVAASAGGNRTTSAADSRALSVVAPPPRVAAAPCNQARPASSVPDPARTNLGHVSLSCEISAHRLRFFLFCNSGSTYGEDFASPPPSYNHPISRYYNSPSLINNNHGLVENRPYVQRQYMHPPALAINEEPAASPIITEYSQEPTASPIKPLHNNNDLNNTESLTTGKPSLSISHHVTQPSRPSQKPNIIHEYGSAYYGV